MAKKIVVHLVDDFDGQTLEAGDAEVVRVTLDGASYELDLSHKNAQKLRDDFGKWLDHGRRAGGRPRTRSGRRSETTRDPSQTKAIREWAISSGLDVSSRGRIPVTIVEAYEAAH